MRTIELSSGARIGPGEPCYLIAEAGVNHNGDMGLARELVDAAYEAGADAVKFQTFVAEEVISAQAPQAEYQKANLGQETSQLEMVRPYQFDYDQFLQLRDYADQRGITFLSTPHDITVIAWLERLDVAAFKVGSADVTNLPYLRRLARSGRPVLLSTGMSTLSEVEGAIATLRSAGDPPLLLYHCVSNYPSNPADSNLRAMATLRAAFDVPVGFSDHTLGITAAVAAVALGAMSIEKHLTLSHDLPGPDHVASLEPEGFKTLVDAVREVESALGDGVKRRLPSEANTHLVARKSLVARRDLPAGTVLSEDMLAVKRPGSGLDSSYLPVVLGRTLVRALAVDALLTWDHLMG